MAGPAHGTRRGYRQGCRCLPCRAANAAYEHQRRHSDAQRLAEPGWAARHLDALRQRGLGLKRLAQRTGLDIKTLRALRRGTRTAIHQATERAILDV